MVVDASALVAILFPEEDGPALLLRLERAERLAVSPIAVWEAVVALARLRNAPLATAQQMVSSFLALVGAETVPIDDAIGTAALDAFARYGKGRHPAALNMGDCFAYACARTRGLPILCKGDDFSQTDINRA